jgi:zinc transporter
MSAGSASQLGRIAEFTMTLQAATTYGSDRTGLISGYLFSPGKPALVISADEAVDWLDQTPESDPGFIWLHFNLAHAACEKWIRQHFDLSEAYYEALQAGSRSTRIEQVEGGLVAVINDVRYEFSGDAAEVSTLWVHVDRRVLLSVRRHPLRSIDLLRAAVRAGDCFRSPVELLVHLFLDQADVLEKIVRDATARTDSIEDLTLAGRSEHKRAELGTLRRVLVKLRRVLAPEPSALFRLLSRPPGWIAEADVLDLRQATEEFSSVLSDIAALQERIKLTRKRSPGRSTSRTTAACSSSPR